MGRFSLRLFHQEIYFVLIIRTQASLQNIATGGATDSDIIDIDLNDPEVEKAAFKIQAGFRGHLARKSIKSVHSIDLNKPADD